jgi:hypothetical protein
MKNMDEDDIILNSKNDKLMMTINRTSNNSTLMENSARNTARKLKEIEPEYEKMML